MESMEVGNSNTTFNGNGVNLPLILLETSGKGLPYALINWPEPGDKWNWRVGKRVAKTGHFLDRYLNPPKHLPRVHSSSGRTSSFKSKCTVEQYIQEKFPGSDVDSFFASFSWKIPAKQLQVNVNEEGCPSFPALFIADSEEDSESDSQSESIVCKAGNKKCSSLIMKVDDTSLTAMPCDICHDEPQFCHVCCCILCNKHVDLNFGGYSYIKCEAKLGEAYTCGHVAHLNCALRCYLAGTAGGSTGLDAEYFCRLCNTKTDLISHATRLVQTCESVTCEDDVEQILNLGFCILRGSQKANSKKLPSRIELAREKLKRATSPGDIWKVGEDLDTDVSTGMLHSQKQRCIEEGKEITIPAVKTKRYI